MIGREASLGRGRVRGGVGALPADWTPTGRVRAPLRMGGIVVKTALVTCAMLGVALAPLSCAPAAPAEAPPPEIDMKALVDGNTAFALDLYARLAKEGGNLLFSPYSVSVALGMTYAGARGNTEAQMSRALHFALPQERLHPAFGALQGKLRAIQQKGAVELAVANALWAQERYPFAEAYLELVKKQYGAELRSADFTREFEPARLEINRWVEMQTKEKIRDLLAPGALDPLTTLVLVNAVYFKGDWAHPFDRKATESAPFFVAVDKTTDVPLMHEERRLGYFETDSVQVLELPYAGGDLSMVVLLPKRTDGLSELERSLEPAKLAAWIAALDERQVSVYLPRFKAESQFELKATLAAMGMPDAFGSSADFTGMSPTGELFISLVVHKAWADVNEEGTEAAAATAVVMARVSFEEPTVFRADHPFIFLIRDTGTGSILFLGRVAEPAR
jgi:serpin B